MYKVLPFRDIALDLYTSTLRVKLPEGKDTDNIYPKGLGVDASLAAKGGATKE